MMKKLLLLLAAGAVATGANAQRLEASSSMMKQSAVGAQQYESSKELPTAAEMKKLTSWKYENNSSKKGTISGTRTYNYVDLLGDVLNKPVQNGFPYLWSTGDAIANFTSGYDSSRFMGFGSVLHPWYEVWNDGAVPAYAGKIGIQFFSPYTVDSVGIYTSYGQNSMKTNIVDTLRVTFVMGNGATGSNDVRITRFWGGNLSSAYGVDTIRVPDVQYDFSLRGAASPSGSRIVRNIPLTQAVLNDTLPNGINRVAVPIGANVPAGYLTAVTATVITGDATYQPLDTIFHGSNRPNEPFAFNMARPLIYEENPGQYATYQEGNYNSGLGLLNILDTGNVFYGRYLTQYGWTAESSNEFPYIDWIVSCADCPPVSVANVDNTVASHKAYPNPANNSLTIEFGLDKTTNVDVKILNVVGQQVAAESFNNVTKGEAKFNTTNIPSGIYMYVIDADGQRSSGRVTVSH